MSHSKRLYGFDLRERRHLERLEHLAPSTCVNRGVDHPPSHRNVTEGDVLDVVLDVLDVGSNILNVEAEASVEYVDPKITDQDHYYCLFINPRCHRQTATIFQFLHTSTF